MARMFPLLIREYMHRWEFCGPVQSPEFSDVRYSGNDIQPYVPRGPHGAGVGCRLSYFYSISATTSSFIHDEH